MSAIAGVLRMEPSKVESVMAAVVWEWRRRTVWLGAVWGGISLAVCYLAGWTGDFFGWFSWGAYDVWRIVLAGAIGLPLASSFLWAWFRPPDRRGLALELEKRYPELYDRLICAVEMETPPPEVSRELIAALKADAGSVASHLPGRHRLAPLPWWMKGSGYAVGATAIILTLLHPFFFQKMFNQPLTHSRLRALMPSGDKTEITGFSVTLHFPSYTGLPPVTQQDEGAVHAPVGTVAEIAVRMQGGSRTGRVVFEGGHSVVLDVREGVAVGRFTIDRQDRYRFAIAQTEPSPYYPITLIQDRPPQVVWVAPPNDERVTAAEELVIKGRATDDYGISRFELVYAVNGGDPVTLPLQGDREARTKWEGHLTMMLETLPLQVNDTIACFVRAWDNQPVPQPGVSDFRFFEIRPSREDYQEDNSPAGKGKSQDMIDLIAYQRNILRETWRLDRQRPKPVTDFFVKVSKATGVQQLELQGLAEEKAGESDGDIATWLHQASGLMGRAESHLKVGATVETLPLQQQALGLLTKALREHLHQIKKNQGEGDPPDREIKDQLEDHAMRLEKEEKKAEEMKKEMDNLAKKIEALRKEQAEVNQQAKSQQPSPGKPSPGEKPGQSPGQSPGQGSGESQASQSAQSAQAAASRAHQAVQRAQAQMEKAAGEGGSQARENEERKAALERGQKALEQAEAHSKAADQFAQAASEKQKAFQKAPSVDASKERLREIREDAERALQSGVQAEQEAARAEAEARAILGESVIPQEAAVKAARQAEGVAAKERQKIEAAAQGGTPEQLEILNLTKLFQRQRELEKRTRAVQDDLAKAGTDALPVGYELGEAASAMQRAGSNFNYRRLETGIEEGVRAEEFLRSALEALEQASGEGERRTLERLAERADLLKERQEQAERQTKDGNQEGAEKAQEGIGKEAGKLGKALEQASQESSPSTEPGSSPGAALMEEAKTLVGKEIKPGAEAALKALKNRKQEEALKWQKKTIVGLDALIAALQKALEERLGEGQTFSPRGVHVSSEMAPAEHREAVKRYFERLGRAAGPIQERSAP